MVYNQRWRTALRAANLISALVDSPPDEPPLRFVLLSSPRCGTTWVTDMLDSHEQIVCYSEVFAHDHFGNLPDGGCHDITTWDSFATLKLPSLGRLGRLKLYFEYLDQVVFAPQPGIRSAGFKIMYEQTKRGFAIPAYFKIRKVHLVHLVRRNHLDVLLSHEALKVRKYYHASPGSHWKPAMVRLEPETLEYRLEQLDQVLRQASQFFSCLGVPYLEVAYEELLDHRERFADILRFLSVEPTVEKLTSTVQKLSPRDHRETIQNYDEVKQSLHNTPFASLLR